MNSNEFDVNYWENVWKNVVLPTEVSSENEHEIHRILSDMLPNEKLDLVEIGCAPGRWLAYFHKQYTYSVYGVEYAEQACAKTVENLRMLNVPAEIENADFFDYRHPPFDVVFSGGFIEHFKELDPVIERIVALCKREGIVITIIPHMGGINWLISKVFRPHVAAGHFPISKKELGEIHERHGLKTLYLGYTGSLRIILPIDKNRFSKEHPKMSWLINLPFRVWNKVIDVVTKKTGVYPHTGVLSRGVLYIGKRI